jgi:hypothetical protein
MIAQLSGCCSRYEVCAFAVSDSKSSQSMLPPISALGLLERQAISYFRRGLVLRANAMWQAPTSTHPFSLPPGICDLYAVLSLRISSCAKAEQSFLKQAMWLW